MYTGNDLNLFKNGYPENNDPKSRQLVKACLTNTKNTIEFTDFYWTKKDYLDCLKEANFEVLDVHYPLGLDTDAFEWNGEKSK